MEEKRYNITKEDIIKRMYFVIKLVQVQKNTTMHGALTSKSDSMGGIFDRFINTISDDIIFDKIILPELTTKERIKVVSDYYLYKPTKNGTGIAPDVFGISVNGKIIPFVEFNDKWQSIENTPQIEVKTFKEKDQMISLRNQDYDEKFLVLVDLDLRKDYLTPFFSKEIFNDEIYNQLKIDDTLFIKNDSKSKIVLLDKIDFSSDDIGTMKLIAITKAKDFMNQSTLCSSNISVRRMKEITERKINIKENENIISLVNYAEISSKANILYEFNNAWYKKTNVGKEEICLDFSATNIENIFIRKFNKSGIVLEAKQEGCSFNEKTLEVGKQYNVSFETLNRSGNNGTEYFMQKQCAKYLNSEFENLKNQLMEIIKNNS